MALVVNKTGISGVFIVATGQFEDSRGSFSRFFCREELGDVLAGRSIANINCSLTKQKGAVRGMHYQLPPFAEMKMVRCVKGRIFDVAVDLRTGSSTFLRWHAEELSPENKKMMVIPEGFAHGFQALEADSEIIYLVTNTYQPKYEGGIMFNDPLVAIDWPLAPVGLSERDLKHALLTPSYEGIALPGAVGEVNNQP
ncbi:MAG TPA: dTDP-4-dehydrorhamnose 3,5-epimerase [Candidatus Rifleibacterium sp.]|nr:dTDP-4-dehydrorhamnose 3,5-epimerase [Candidatus Rifleibacterium sp.]HPT47887.1 dTDP-4-dehydrorhamnose 3,5-epimerase [Candidatus Rifleibacterium sp.]